MGWAAGTSNGSRHVVVDMMAARLQQLAHYRRTT
jgi:hypothetical protein